MSTDDLRALVARLNASAAGLTVLGAALDARVRGVTLALQPQVDAVLDELGARAALDAASPSDLPALLAEIHSFGPLNARLVDAPGWRPDEPEVLAAAGEVTAGFPAAFKARVAPALGDLLDRLERPGAAFLEVGVGVARIAIGMAQLWPALRVVGLDVWPPALAIARENVGRAGLGDRIELREQPGEALVERDAYDLAWIPSAFVPEAVMPALVGRVARALRPGGWLLCPVLTPGAGSLAAAVMRLRVAGFGGYQGTIAAATHLLEAAGLEEVHLLPAPPTAATALLVGRRR